MLAGRALDVEKLEITAVALGIAAAAVEDAWRYAQERASSAERICAHQAVRHMLVEAKTRLAACRHMLYHALARDRGARLRVEGSMAKLFVADTPSRSSSPASGCWAPTAARGTTTWSATCAT